MPQNFDQIKEIKSNAYFILIVEKDSIFQKLLDEDAPNELSRPFIMITVRPNLKQTYFYCKKI